MTTEVGAHLFVNGKHYGKITAYYRTTSGKDTRISFDTKRKKINLGFEVVE